MEVFIEISVIIAITAVIAGVLHLFKQPLIIGYILTGIIVGPSLFNFVSFSETMSIFAHIGVALLLFTVGLGLDPKIIKYVGKVSLITGLSQVVFTSVIGYFIAFVLGFSVVSSIYIAIALTFSSTIIIMKLLSDKGDIETLYGKIAIGFLLVQDLVVILVLLAVSSISTDFDVFRLAFGFISKGVALFGVVFLASIYLLPRIIRVIAKSQEFLLLFSISWCLALASLSYCLNFSIEIGALLAGVTLAISPYRREISSRMIPLRDFFIVLFFILLGSQMNFADIGQYLVPILIFSAFILIGNPLIVMIIMGLLGYTKRNSFLAGLTVAQISEFSLIFIALGVQVGHLSSDILSFVTVIGLITIAGSTYLILYADKIYSQISKYLNIFERKGKKVDEHKYHSEELYSVILFGYDRIGFDILRVFEKMRKKFLVVDYDPQVIEKLAEQGVSCRYGDADDLGLHDELNLSKVRMVVSTMPKLDTNLMLINKIREVNARAVVIVLSHRVDEALALYDAGATYVMLPHFLGGHHVSAMINKYGLSVREFTKIKERHVRYLNKRKDIAHEYLKH